MFQPQIDERINKTSSVKVIVISSDHRHFWRDSFKGAASRLASDYTRLLLLLCDAIIYRKMDDLRTYWDVLVFSIEKCNFFVHTYIIIPHNLYGKLNLVSLKLVVLVHWTISKIKWRYFFLAEQSWNFDISNSDKITQSRFPFPLYFCLIERQSSQVTHYQILTLF